MSLEKIKHLQFCGKNTTTLDGVVADFAIIRVLRNWTLRSTKRERFKRPPIARTTQPRLSRFFCT